MPHGGLLALSLISYGFEIGLFHKALTPLLRLSPQTSARYQYYVFRKIMLFNLTDGIKHSKGFCLHPQGRRVIGS